MKPLNIIPCGTLVTVKMAQVQGMITAVVIRFDRVIYEVKYFLDGDERILPMVEEEFTPWDGKKRKIGFCNSDNQLTE